MARLDQATPQALNLPGYRLHSLKGDLQGFRSVTVRANWRIIFRFEGKMLLTLHGSTTTSEVFDLKPTRSPPRSQSRRA